MWTYREFPHQWTSTNVKWSKPNLGWVKLDAAGSCRLGKKETSKEQIISYWWKPPCSRSKRKSFDYLPSSKPEAKGKTPQLVTKGLKGIPKDPTNKVKSLYTNRSDSTV